jgi:hypothetical protein
MKTKTPRESYTWLKKRSDTGVIAEHSAPKRSPDRMLESAEIVAERCANRARAGIGILTGTSLYLAIKWQRGCVNARCASGDRRFPTPHDWQNTTEKRGKGERTVTTGHLFRPNQPRKVASSLRFWLPNSDFLGSECSKVAEGGRGRQPDAHAEVRLSIALTEISTQKGALHALLVHQKSYAHCGQLTIHAGRTTSHNANAK